MCLIEVETASYIYRRALTTIVCEIFSHVEHLQGYSGTDEVPNGSIDVRTNPAYAKRLINSEPIQYSDRVGWIVDASISPPTVSQSEPRDLTITIERSPSEDIGHLDVYSLVALNLTVHEDTTWIEYGEIRKRIIGTDGASAEYIPDWEIDEYNDKQSQEAFMDVFLSLIPGAHAHQAADIYHILKFADALANIQDNLDSPGVDSNNCWDDVGVTVLVPSRSVQKNPSIGNTYIPRGIRVEIPIHLSDDEHISLTVTPEDGEPYSQTNLLNSDEERPSCPSP